MKWKIRIFRKIPGWDLFLEDMTVRSHVTVYHGKSGALKVTQLVVPVGAEMRLSNGRIMNTPLEVFESGKRTDAPVLAGICPLRKGEKLYFCIYKQNREADYADFMLPDLFKQENEKQ